MTSLRSRHPLSILVAGAPLTYCAALGTAPAAISVIEVNVVVNGSNGQFATSDNLTLALPGAASLQFHHRIGPVFTAPPPLPGRADAAVNGGGIAGFVSRGMNYLINFSPGATPGTLPFLPSGVLDPGYYGAGGEFGMPGPAFLSFQFDGGNGTQSGWAELNMVGFPFNSFTVVRYAYAGPGEALAVGQVPEPNTPALLALGAAGVVAQRRRRKRRLAMPGVVREP